MFDLTGVKTEITWQIEQLQVFHISVLVYVAVSLSLVSTLFLLVVREARQAVKRRQSIVSMPESCPSGWGTHLPFNLNLHPSWLRSTSQPIIFTNSTPSRSFHFHSGSVVLVLTPYNFRIMFHSAWERMRIQIFSKFAGAWIYFFCICCIEMKVKSRHIEWLHCPGKLPICSVVKGDCYTFHCQCNDQISQEKKLTWLYRNENMIHTQVIISCFGRTVYE